MGKNVKPRLVVPSSKFFVPLILVGLVAFGSLVFLGLTFAVSSVLSLLTFPIVFTIAFGVFVSVRHWGVASASRIQYEFSRVVGVDASLAGVDVYHEHT